MTPNLEQPVGDLADIAAYYSDRLTAHGATPLGVDWSCRPTQDLRFVQLLRGLALPYGESLNDLGCGYGALLDHLDARHPGHETDYLGIDASEAMVATARKRFRNRPQIAFAQGTRSLRTAGYCVASGIFNVKLDRPCPQWEGHIRTTLQAMASHVRHGMAFNMLHLHHRHSSHPQELYFADPDIWRQWCEQALGMRALVLDDYGMKEFTLVCSR